VGWFGRTGPNLISSLWPAPGAGPALASLLSVVADVQKNRFSVSTDQGEHVADHATPLGFQALQTAGLAGGGMMIFGPRWRWAR